MNIENSVERSPAVEFTCVCCGKVISICRSCWRGQKYCSPVCAKEAHVKRHRENQKRYRLTDQGREAHKAHQKNYRLRQKNRE